MMQTKVLKPSHDAMMYASELLHRGSLVAFPTETVYGLGANALEESAVRSIFAAKGRPADNPLIVHIADRCQLSDFCLRIPPKAEVLMDNFWPGPLTLLFERTDVIPDVVTAGLPTVAVRMPSHPIAAALLKECGLPVAAPSANSSGKPSPTNAEHVWDDMQGKIPLILDGGSCDIGVESTVVDLCHGDPVILRPGGITKDMLESVLCTEIQIAGSVLRPLGKDEKALSPGMRYRHYAPSGNITLVEGSEEHVLQMLRQLYTDSVSQGKKSCVLCFTEHVSLLSDCVPHDLGSGKNPEEIARKLFKTLRNLDAEGMEMIFSEVIPPEGVGLAVMNRLGRAASFRTIHAD